VDLGDLVSFARNFNLTAPDALARLAHFAQSVMTNVGPVDLLQRLQSLVRGTATKSPTDVERVAKAVVQFTSPAMTLRIKMSRRRNF
jgi:DNA helicase-2/ATP-dependent DNA helicase PcrA